MKLSRRQFVASITIALAIPSVAIAKPKYQMDKFKINPGDELHFMVKGYDLKIESFNSELEIWVHHHAQYDDEDHADIEIFDDTFEKKYNYKVCKGFNVGVIRDIDRDRIDMLCLVGRVHHDGKYSHSKAFRIHIGTEYT